MEQKDRDHLKRYFKNYQDNLANDKQRESIDRWFEQFMAQDEPELLKNDVSAQRIHNELHERIKRAIAPQKSIRPISFWAKMAACLIIGTTLTGIFWNKLFYQTQPQVSRVSYQKITTANQELRKVVLPDSTEVWLNAKTNIRIGQSFTASASRDLYLDEGEAFFKVKRDTSRPFYVITGRLRTRVLGTQFNIRAYHPERKYEVAVVSGSVAVEKLDVKGRFTPMITRMAKGEVFTVNNQNKAVHANGKDTELISAWRQGQFSYLAGATLSELAAEIGRRYNLQVTVKHNELDKSTYTLKLEQLSLGDQLLYLVRKTGISYRLSDRELIIYPYKHR